ncbi:MAG: hypothetical protein EBR34_08350 [Sphingomonadaceae bacterium]|nr:hypothetical protein [Sphingomonadaceae bacterium]
MSAIVPTAVDVTTVISVTAAVALMATVTKSTIEMAAMLEGLMAGVWRASPAVAMRAAIILAAVVPADGHNHRRSPVAPIGIIAAVATMGVSGGAVAPVSMRRDVNAMVSMPAMMAMSAARACRLRQADDQCAGGCDREKTFHGIDLLFGMRRPDNRRVFVPLPRLRRWCRQRRGLDIAAAPVVTVAMVRHLHLQQTVGKALAARNKPIGGASRLVACQHLLASDASAERHGGKCD